MREKGRREVKERECSGERQREGREPLESPFFRLIYEGEAMVSDQDIAKGVETLLRQSEPNSFTSLNGVVKQLEAKLGLDLSHKAAFIRDQISFLLRSHPQPLPPKDHFALQQHPQFLSPHPQIPSHFALQHHRPPPEDLNFLYPLPQPQQHQPQTQPQPQPHHLPKGEAFLQNAASVAAQAPKERSVFPQCVGLVLFGLAEMLVLGFVWFNFMVRVVILCFV